MSSSLAVTLDDQERINEFSVLNMRNMRLQRQIADLDQKLQNYRDAQADLDMQILEADDDLDFDKDDEAKANPAGTNSVPFKVGSVFFHMPPVDALAKVESEITSICKEKDAAADEKAQIEVRAAALKRTLYAKFGDAIRLEPAEGIDSKE